MPDVRGKEVEEEEEMEPETARRMWEEGGFLVVTHLLPGTEFGVDLRSWTTGEQFLGVKMIPPGLHYIYYSPVSKDGQPAPRTGFFHLFHRGELVVRRYDAASEQLQEVGESEVAGLRGRLRDLDPRLGPYPTKQWRKWVALSSRLTAASLARLMPATGEVCAVTQVAREEGELVESREARINYTTITRERHPAGCSGALVTQHGRDATYRLERMLDTLPTHQEVLVELQFSFLCFLVAQNYDSFEHWKQLVAMLCTCVRAMLHQPSLFVDFMADLHFQMQEVPEDFFVDIVSADNFLVASLTNLFANIREHDDMAEQLRTKAISFENHLTKKFGWNFSEEDEEDAPVVVEL